MERRFFVLGAVLAMIGVAAGAFGAHALKSRLAPDMLAVFETGVRYHLVHALALLAVAWAVTRWGGGDSRRRALCVRHRALQRQPVPALALTGERWLGVITPVGGVAFIAGWACLAWAAWRRPR